MQDDAKTDRNAATSRAERASPPTDKSRRQGQAGSRRGPMLRGAKQRCRSIETVMVLMVMARSSSHAKRSVKWQRASRRCSSAPFSRAPNIVARDALKAEENNESKRSSSPRQRSLVWRPMSKSTARCGRGTSFGCPVDPEVAYRAAMPPGPEVSIAAGGFACKVQDHRGPLQGRRLQEVRGSGRAVARDPYRSKRS